MGKIRSKSYMLYEWDDVVYKNTFWCLFNCNNSGLKQSGPSVIAKTEQSGYRSDGFSQRESPESSAPPSAPPSSVGPPIGYDHMDAYAVDKNHFLTRDLSSVNGYGNGMSNGHNSPPSMNGRQSHDSCSNRHQSNIPPSPSPTPSPMHLHQSPPSVGSLQNSKEYQTLTTVGPIYQAVQSSIGAYSTQPNFSVSTIIQRNQPTTAYAKI